MRVPNSSKPTVLSDALWVFPKVNKELSSKLALEVGISENLAQILTSREITTKESIEKFISIDFDKRHDPFLLKGMQESVERIHKSIQNGEKIGVYSDYDVDGISGAAVLHHFFKDIEINCVTIIPDRNDEIYGMTIDHIKRFQEADVSLIITVDCGISSAKAVNFSQQEGIDVIITDHHQLPAVLPKASSIIHPFQEGCNYPFKFLSGVGLAFKLAEACKLFLENAPDFSKELPDLRKYSGYVALGTVADVVPLTDENRVLVANGLKEITKGTCKGLELLKKVASLERKDIVVNDLAFKINPKINTPGKIDHADKSFRLLTEDNEELLLPIVEDIKELNQKRQTLQGKALHEAHEMIERTINLNNSNVIVLASENWHTGVLGSIATRLVDRYNRPTILLHISKKGFAKGSGRSIPAYNLFEGLRKNSHLINAYGGHKFAVGLSIDADKVDVFRKALNKTVMADLSPLELTPRIRVDLELGFEKIESVFFKEISLLAPFGVGNPTPVLYNKNVWIYEEPKRLGKRGEHVSIELHDGQDSLTVIGYYMSDFFDDFDWEGNSFEVLFSPILNSLNKRESIRFFLRKIRPYNQ